MKLGYFFVKILEVVVLYLEVKNDGKNNYFQGIFKCDFLVLKMVVIFELNQD